MDGVDNWDTFKNSNAMLTRDGVHFSCRNALAPEASVERVLGSIRMLFCTAKAQGRYNKNNMKKVYQGILTSVILLVNRHPKKIKCKT